MVPGSCRRSKTARNYVKRAERVKKGMFGVFRLISPLLMYLSVVLFTFLARLIMIRFCPISKLGYRNIKDRTISLKGAFRALRAYANPPTF